MEFKFDKLYNQIITEQRVIHEGWLGKLATGAALGASLVAGAKAEQTKPVENIHLSQDVIDDIKAHEKAGDCIDLAKKFIKEHEGVVKDPKTGKHKVYKDEAGNDTIGYGSTDPDLVAKKQITDKEAEDQLAKDLKETLEGCKKRYGKDWDSLDEHQKAALISLHFNAGLYVKADKLNKYIKQHDYIKAANEFLDIDNVKVIDPETGETIKKKSAGLTQRRQDEVNQLFLYWYND